MRLARIPMLLPRLNGGGVVVSQDRDPFLAGTALHSGAIEPLDVRIRRKRGVAIVHRVGVFRPVADSPVSTVS